MFRKLILTSVIWTFAGSTVNAGIPHGDKARYKNSAPNGGSYKILCRINYALGPRRPYTLEMSNNQVLSPKGALLMSNYIGMDAHSKTCMFVVVNSKGEETKSIRINTSEAEIVKFIRSLRGKKYLTFEESQMSRWLHVFIKDEVDKLLVCNPCYVAKRKGPKNDYQDALHLAQQLRGEFLIPVFHDDSFLSDLRRVVSSYENITRDLIKAKCRFKALFTSRAILLPGTKVYTTNAKAIVQLDTTSQFVARSLLSQIQFLTNAKAEYKEVFKGNANFQESIKLLTTVPEIAEVRANIIAAAVVDPRRFPNKNKFWSYCMLVKHNCESDGKSYGKKTIWGKLSLKGVFMSAAQGGIEGTGAFREYYDQQIANGCNPTAAKKNLARHIAAICLAIMKTGKPYEERITKKINENVV
jgi:transposase